MKTKFLPFTLALLIAPAAFAQDYSVWLQRPVKTGDEQRISVTAKMSQSVTQTVNDGPPQEDKHEVTVQLDGEEKMLAVNSDGKETKIALTVDKLTQFITDTPAPTELVPKGTVIMCAAGDKNPVFQINGRPADPQVSRALNLVIDLHPGTDDDIYGTKDHKKKGDNWAVNADVVKSEFEAAASGAQFTDISGKTTLDDVAGGILKITARVAGKVKPQLPQGVILDDSSLNIIYSGSFPVDLTKYPPEVTQTMTMSFTAHADGAAGKAIVKTVVEQSVDRKVTPVK